MDKYCLLNGEIKDTDKPVLKLSDLSLLRGYGVFDFFPIRHSKPVFLHDYWNRFRSSSLQMRLPFEFDLEPFMHQLSELLDKNNRTDGYCRLLLTGGYSNNGFHPDGPPNFITMTQGPIHYNEKNYSQGIKLITLEHIREHPQIKSINYMKVLLERDRLLDEQAEDVLYFSEEIVSESSRSNFFIVNEKGILQTPQHDVLAGITRSKVLELAPKYMEVQVTDISIEETKKAQAAFITSTTKGIMPVIRIDDNVINNGQIHPIVSQFQDALEENIQRYLKELK